MLSLVTLIIYAFCSFGFAELLVYYDGFLHIFDYIRRAANWFHPHIGELFSCVICCSSWVGICLSLVDFFFVPIAFTPFNMILGTTRLWWLIMILDMGITAGFAIILNHIDELVDKISIYYDERNELGQ